MALAQCLYCVYANATKLNTTHLLLILCCYIHPSVGGLFSHRILNDAYRQTTDEGLRIDRFARFWTLVVPYRLHCPHPPSI